MSRNAFLDGFDACLRNLDMHDDMAYESLAESIPDEEYELALEQGYDDALTDIFKGVSDKIDKKYNPSLMVANEKSVRGRRGNIGPR